MPRYYYSLITISDQASAVKPMTIIVGPSEEMARLGEYREMFIKLLEDLGRSDLLVSELLGIHLVPPPHKRFRKKSKAGAQSIPTSGATQLKSWPRL
jgi:hypothetical protein